MKGRDPFDPDSHNGWGIAAGVTYWLVFAVWLAHDSSCVHSRTCTGGDFFLYGIIMVAMAAVAAAISMIVSGVIRGDQ